MSVDPDDHRGMVCEFERLLCLHADPSMDVTTPDNVMQARRRTKDPRRGVAVEHHPGCESSLCETNDAAREPDSSIMIPDHQPPRLCPRN